MSYNNTDLVVTNTTKKCGAANCRFADVKTRDGSVYPAFISYSTIVGIRIGGRWTRTDKRYSTTTSKQMSVYGPLWDGEIEDETLDKILKGEACPLTLAAAS